MFLTYISKKLQAFLNDEEAASAIEYAIVIAMVAVVAVLFITPLSNEIKSIFNSILTALGGTAVP
jgi:pilus assembly protein Flp/PilA